MINKNKMVYLSFNDLRYGQFLNINYQFGNNLFFADFETVIRNLEAKNQELYLKTTDFERSDAERVR